MRGAFIVSLIRSTILSVMGRDRAKYRKYESGADKAKKWKMREDFEEAKKTSLLDYDKLIEVFATIKARKVSL